MSGVEERRRAARIKTDLETFFSSAREEGRAVLTDVSAFGALLEQTELRPRPGTRVRVSVFLPGEGAPLDLMGDVVRHTENGFALNFEKPNRDIYQLVEDDPAAVTVPDAASGNGAPAGGPGGSDAAKSPSRMDFERLRQALEFVVDAAIAARDGADDVRAETLRSILERAGRTLESLERD